MPLIDLQEKLGINIDKWMLIQSGIQPRNRPARCHVFEKDWIECAHGIGKIRAKKECKLELEDFYECMHRKKLDKRLTDIKAQREKLIKEGKYTPPDHHTGKSDQRP
ncbi:NADH dehydrogenase [ubiquinone] iron-sulfur protein 5 [Pristis pectinata]|uniref:NADH dehydrogenase [ubiquinone] iron-sulfur protein 5 n=1 Tax=Pristis pectinata TaxID=685728 RepID=UPI00223E8A47|nr:NADH dehydrogenase [ubiquinone] iron-sulfur protein 5 [Pristis pectinata]XP_051892302.1 NADH dehydrogenase [ubiquinone] iron-sulfur protein 5 [Pristis pectinata]XP_051892303.1 NADH dehydrogenase [ubiquinone] iron-sulfur protein 5 [Pristis pectinata]XP_051892304.1 NADH dehydrogenase [ubiquinone] iron-sulfur protein 5 [Pristis pectinata]XP_051892305.1 NADH dehydrogenase [ubiquinone] iron-sulfur protein 5 [Pristis pectinata]XP_051892306.1 NADH dehydrogenase [ubiquinone] iron-sulfur protein 5 [